MTIDPSYCSHDSNLSFTEWMDLLAQKSFLEQDQACFLKALQQHPEWLNQTNDRGQTPLIHLMDQDHQKLSCLLSLIEFHADLNRQDQEGYTALMHSIRWDHEESFFTLIRSGADLDIQAQDGMTALMFALMQHCLNDSSLFIRELIKKGARLNLQDQQGRTVLMLAIKFAKYDVMQELIKRSDVKDLNLQDRDGYTALMWAVHYGHSQVFYDLLMAGADETISSKDSTLLEKAREKNNAQIIDFLEAFILEKQLHKTLGSSNVLMNTSTISSHQRL